MVPEEGAVGLVLVLNAAKLACQPVSATVHFAVFVCSFPRLSSPLIILR